MRNKIQAPGKQVLHKQVPKAQAIQKEKDPRLVAVGGFGQAPYFCCILSCFIILCNICDICAILMFSIIHQKDSFRQIKSPATG